VNAAKLPLIGDKNSGDTHESFRLTRRQAVQKLLTGLAGVLAQPAVASAHPIFRHLASDSTLQQVDAKLAAGEWHPEFLNLVQNDTLVAIAERIVPGSKQAQVNRIIDVLLSVDTVPNQKSLLSSLVALDGEAKQKYEKQFSLLSPKQQDDVLAACSAAKPSPSPGEPADPDELGPPKELITSRDHFENLKAWIVGAYYATQQGMRELGWTEDFYFDELPGCDHEGAHPSGAGSGPSAGAVKTASEMWPDG
jgi:Gluconate 2-dehydrogenase subunit 3